MFDAATAGDWYRQGMQLSIGELEKAVGGLTQTSKMPWLSYSLSAKHCRTGSKLRKVEGSVCSKCYACKGFYCMPVVQKAQANRLRILLDDPEKWAGYMAALIERKSGNIEAERRYFRWHDSGDVQSPEHLAAIFWIARRLPEIKFYLPTKEGWTRKHTPPPNLVVRCSMPLIGKPAPNLDGHWATVGAGKGFPCPASDRTEYECRDCRACWDPATPVVDYAQH